MINTTDSEDTKIIIIYNSYTPAQKKASKKYYEQNKEKYIENSKARNKIYYEKIKNTEEYKEHVKNYNELYYQKRKMKILENENTTT